jgi:hypothetical protein
MPCTETPERWPDGDCQNPTTTQGTDEDQQRESGQICGQRRGDRWGEKDREGLARNWSQRSYPSLYWSYLSHYKPI